MADFPHESKDRVNPIISSSLAEGSLSRNTIAMFQSLAASRGGKRGEGELLRQAVDAFQQASELEKELKRSEASVSQQTKQLRNELAKAKATAQTTGQSEYFRKEERLDKQLMKQAERETQRDKKLVAQAEKEMEGDKKFLESAYHVKDLGGLLTADNRNGACPELQCHQARAAGLSPRHCTVLSGGCPTIRCYQYQSVPSSTCTAVTVCRRPSASLPGCRSRSKARWVHKTCPAMPCSLAKKLYLQPDFCSISAADGTCPQISCFHYTDLGDCQLPPPSASSGLASPTSVVGPPGFSPQGSVCLRPDAPDAVCQADLRALRAAGGGANAAAGPPGAANPAPRRASVLSYAKSLGLGRSTRTEIFVVLLILSLGAGAAFVLFKRYGATLAAPGSKKPPPVPAYYGRL